MIRFSEILVWFDDENDKFNENRLKFRSCKTDQKELNTENIKKIINEAWNFIIISDAICTDIIQEFVSVRKSIYDAFVEWVSVC